MKQVKCKLKGWYEENKGEIKRDLSKLMWYGFGFVVGGVAASKLGDLATSAGLCRAHDEGILKFFNPFTNEEISVDEAGKLMYQLAKKR
jgi:hypothetical protein